MRQSLVVVSLFAMSVLCGGIDSQAAVMTYTFRSVTNDPGSGGDDANVATGESQMYVLVDDVGMASNEVRFTFWNWGGLNASSITDVYFDDGTLLDVAEVQNGSGTLFADGAAPGEPFLSLPDPLDNGIPTGFVWNDPELEGTHFDLDSTGSTPAWIANGVNPYEAFAIVYELQGSQTFNDVIDALELGLNGPTAGDDGALGVADWNEDFVGGLRIAIRVNGFGGPGDSSSTEVFVNGESIPFEDGPPLMPEPASMAIWSLGLAMVGGIGAWRRRRSKAAA
jgi:MYXO-CTERM domain-containing protein